MKRIFFLLLFLVPLILNAQSDYRSCTLIRNGDTTKVRVHTSWDSDVIRYYSDTITQSSDTIFIRIYYLDGIARLGFTTTIDTFNLGTLPSQISVVQACVFQYFDSAHVYVATPACRAQNIHATGIPNVFNIEQLAFSPNPTSGILQLQTNIYRPEKVTLRFFNPVGQLVLVRDVAIPAGSNKKEIDVSGLPPGLYFVKYKLGKEELFQKILRE